MSIATIVGARPQFVKAAAVSPALAAEGLTEILIHTGQHWDWEMSAAFFEGLGLPEPRYNLRVGSAPHGAQTGRMLEAIERVLMEERPAAVIVYGDTNSTLAGALAASKLGLPVVHVEAGLRSFDRRMPEEINRVVTDHLSQILFAPTETAIKNLLAEGIAQGVVFSGDVMFEVLEAYLPTVEAKKAEVLARFGLRQKSYAFTTVHRAENTDDPPRLQDILHDLCQLAAEGLPVLWPVHPRLKISLAQDSIPGIQATPPLPYLPTQVLLREAAVVLTDSGGLQREAAFHGTPCLVLRDRTEWKELEQEGRVVVAGKNRGQVTHLALGLAKAGFHGPPLPKYTERPSLCIARAVQESLANGRFSEKTIP